MKSNMRFKSDRFARKAPPAVNIADLKADDYVFFSTGEQSLVLRVTKSSSYYSHEDYFELELKAPLLGRTSAFMYYLPDGRPFNGDKTSPTIVKVLRSA